MRMPRSSRFMLNPSDKKVLARMARNGSHVSSLDRGDNSDGDSSASLEEISAEDFQQDTRRLRSRVWDANMMGYSIRNSFGPTLYSFAWAQAVQNKPLGLNVKPVKGSEEEAVKEGSIDAVVIDSSEGSAGEMEKEEGELEEGEIDMDSESVAEETINFVSDNIENDSTLHESETQKTEDIEEADMEDFDRRVAEILEELDTITSEEAVASLEGVCSRLLKSFSGMKAMFEESHASILDVVVQQAFMGIQTLHSVFCSGNLNKTKQNMDLLLRLLIHIKNQYSALLTQEQITEIDSMAQLLASNNVSKEKSLFTESPDRISDHVNQSRKPKNYFVNPEKSNLNLRETDLSGNNSSGIYLPNFESFIAKNRAEFSPLLDLHADYDEGSLPSPTRENAPTYPISKSFDFGTSALSHAKKEKNNITMHSYMNDALKAVSSYQQKYGQNSSLPRNQLPSPTPSEECHIEEEKCDEVSSSFVSSSAKSVKISTSSLKSLGSGSNFSSNAMVGQLCSSHDQVVKVKSRDPRLRLINQSAPISSDQNVFRNGYVDGQANLKKHKAADTILQDDHLLKRKRFASNTSPDFPLSMSSDVSETTGKLQLTGSMEAGMRKGENAVVIADSKVDSNCMPLAASHGKEQTSTTSSVTVALPSLLKGADLNSAMLLELIKRKQHGLAADSSQKSGSVAFTGTNGLPSANGVLLMPMEMGQSASDKAQKTQNDVGRLRMKPRDPRRFRHDTVATKAEALVPEQSKMVPMLCKFQVSKERVADRNPIEPTKIINSSQQLSKNAKIASDNLFSSKITATSSMLPDILQPIISTTNKPDGRIAIGTNDFKTVKCPSPQTNTGDASQGANLWGDVDHLLNGYDDQQKAAIQKERARRIDEQNNMFAARKLCLVLDLDHTLLNSAKFGEVEPVHEEILRKKEEQDREQSQRHLFRLSHMAMWTKLRPGVWKFLEKACKFFELHLYTMGNKLYATEMAKVLDPTGTLFSGRVISRGDEGDPFDGDERVPKSKDLEGVLGMESAVVIIDDSVRVWPHNRHNLILVERYTYFPCSRRQFGLLGPSLLEIDHDERPEDGTLASCLGVIEKIHHIFFSHNCLNDVDVRHILATEQRKILAGCRIVFSRIFPVGEANPHLHPLWQTAEQFGAVCTNQIDEQATHVVANSLGTDKVNWALSTGRHVVHPGWVEASALLYRRANENDFAVKL